MIGADMSRRNTKEEIIDATLELASQNGLGNVSMQQIADKVGIRKASLYNHYPSKEDLIESMYESIRQSSKEKASIIGVDYDALAEKGTIKAVLTTAAESYWRIVSDPRMNRFYRVVMNERTVSGTAAEIMVRETRLMIDSTEKLFRALEDKGKAAFSNVDAAAFSFAMAIHSAIDYRFDLIGAGEEDRDMTGPIIDEFCIRYGTR